MADQHEVGVARPYRVRPGVWVAVAVVLVYIVVVFGL